MCHRSSCRRCTKSTVYYDYYDYYDEEVSRIDELSSLHREQDELSSRRHHRHRRRRSSNREMIRSPEGKLEPDLQQKKKCWSPEHRGLTQLVVVTCLLAKCSRKGPPHFLIQSDMSRTKSSRCAPAHVTLDCRPSNCRACHFDGHHLPDDHSALPRLLLGTHCHLLC